MCHVEKFTKASTMLTWQQFHSFKKCFLNYTLVLSWDYDLVMNLIWYIRVDFAGDVKWSYTVNIVQIWMRFWWENLNLIFIYDYMYSFI